MTMLFHPAKQPLLNELERRVEQLQREHEKVLESLEEVVRHLQDLELRKQDRRGKKGSFSKLAEERKPTDDSLRNVNP